jgi:meso-butanediol dehydrogenase/(S,S)-butanediol dehydrogenase/diacetyl reductase
MERELHGRTYLVTGAGSGMGRATSLRLGREGANVVLLDIDGMKAAAVAHEIGDERRVLVRDGDVSDPSVVESAVAAAIDRFDTMHGAATCAGIFDPGDYNDLTNVDPDVFDRVLGVNLKGTFLVLRSVLPHLESGGAIVTIASTAGLRGHGFGAGYTATKGGVIALTRLAAFQHGKRGVRVNCVCPGATAGEGMGAAWADPEYAAKNSKGIPMRRVGTAAELGNTIVSLLSDDFSYMNGQIIAVDGGATVV